MKYIILKLWKTKLEKRFSCAFYLVIAPLYFLERIADVSAKNIMSLNQIAGSTNDLVWRFKELRASVQEKKN